MKTIGILSTSQLPGLGRLFDALEEILDIRFQEVSAAEEIGIDAWILPDASFQDLHRIARSDRPCYVVFCGDQLVPCGTASTIEFSRHDRLPRPLNGRQIRTDEAIGLKALPGCIANMTVLASKGGCPVWALQNTGGKEHHYVAVGIPELGEGEALFQLFHRGRFLQLLPLLHFLHTLAVDPHWEQPPLQACFMFDDPNLHWRTYGFIDFAQIAAHAELHNYHTCFATIPLDTWFVHKPTASLFRQYQDRLSLLVHGNDHIAGELARPYSNEERIGNLQQALRRIEAFERRSGVEVSKVMAPPHGACSEKTLEEMALLGFEAACISRGSLRHYNGPADWLRTLGMKSSDVIGGLPVFPRFPLAGGCFNSVLIAALLHQPIIAMGHHHDVAGGLQPLADVAGFVNSFGTVRWTDLKRISRAHYAQRIDGSIVHIRMLTRRIEVNVSDGIRKILVERTWLPGAESTPLTWKHLNNGSSWKVQHPQKPIPVLPGQKIEIVAEPLISSFIDSDSADNYHLWPVVRRQLTEARDRMTPMLKHASSLLLK
jgi:hypothetical protein